MISQFAYSQGTRDALEKFAAVFAPVPPVKADKIMRGTSTVGNNDTAGTTKAAPASAVAPIPAQAAAATTSSSKAPGGIVSSTGSAPPANPALDVATQTASHARGETVSRSGGLK